MEHGIKGTDPTWEARLKDFEGRMGARAKILIVPLTEERGQPKAGKCVPGVYCSCPHSSSKRKRESPLFER